LAKIFVILRCNYAEMLTVATLGDVKKTGWFPVMPCHPRWPRQIVWRNSSAGSQILYPKNFTDVNEPLKAAKFLFLKK
jgi:hypothetical protein